MTPAIPAGTAGPAPPKIAVGEGFAVSVPLKQLHARGGNLEQAAFDLTARAGKGRPLALIYWAPGYPLAESTLGTFARFLKEETRRWTELIRARGIKVEP